MLPGAPAHEEHGELRASTASTRLSGAGALVGQCAGGETWRSGSGVAPSGWLVSPRVDAGMIGGALLVALSLGTVANLREGWFTLVLTLDIWLLAYPHVGAMWLHIGLGRGRRFWPLWTLLPPLVLLGTAGVYFAGGAMALNSLYYHWQSFHYTRQSYGISRSYARSAGRVGTDIPADALVFLVPLWGWLFRCSQQNRNFFGAPLWSPEVPEPLVAAVGLCATAVFLGWLWRTQWDGQAWFLLSHVLVTVVSYVWVEEITRGWIFVNLWHNAQYLLFVWARNREGGLVPALTRSLWPFLLACVLGAGGGYGLLEATLELALLVPAGALLVIHQSINLHHYIVDAVIWRGGRTAGPSPGYAHGARGAGGEAVGVAG